MKINMVMLMRDETNGQSNVMKVTFVPATWDMETHLGEVLEQSQAGPFSEFVSKSLQDMEHLCHEYIMVYTKDFIQSGKTLDNGTKADLYGRLLASFSERPMELIGNMLAGMIVGCIEEFVDSGEFDQLYADWSAERTANE